MSGDVTVDIEPDQTTGITTDHRPLGHSNNSQVTGAHDQPVTVTVSVPVSSSSTTTVTLTTVTRHLQQCIAST